jgi:hypothetical protein
MVGCRFFTRKGYTNNGTQNPHFIHNFLFLFYYESRKRELKTRLIYEDRYDERLKN